jgi:protein phosphatase
MKKYHMEVSGLTDIGKKEKNEDSFVYKVVDAGEDFAGLFAVADGVGGLKNGEVASAMAISGINKWWEKEFKQHYFEKDSLVQSLISNIQKANTDIMEYPGKGAGKIATTLALLLIYQNRAMIANVGDSRIYKIHGLLSKSILQLTEDHSCFINYEINNQIIKKSVLTECLGNKKDMKHYYREDPIKNQDIYLVCSDGIYKTLTENQLLNIAKENKNNMNSLCKTLVETAKANGETDNITIIAVKIYKE